MERMKTCFNCQRELPLTDYYRHPRMADGHLNKCKECVIAYQKERLIWNGDYVRQYDRDRGAHPHRVKARKDYATTPKGKERVRVGKLSWAAKNKEKREAHLAVSNAVRTGTLRKKPCQTCGSPFVQAHHDDYTKPLDVRWLCVPCHNAHHKAERQARRKALLESVTLDV